jgi:hypothetical protein
MTVQILGENSWREYRGSVAAPGLNATNHLAVIADNNGGLHDCYVKLMDAREPNLLCEAVGWLLARELDIPVPEFAAVVMVPTQVLSQHMSLPAWTMSHSTCPAWCCEVVRGRSLRQIHKWFVWLAIRRCLKSQDVHSIAAMDVWADNQDRNFGNVILAGKRYIAIDHEALLHALFPPRYGRNTVVDSAGRTLSQEAFKSFCVFVAHAAANHAAAFPMVSPKISQFIQAAYGSVNSVEKMVLDFLQTRSDVKFVGHELGVIA